MSRSSCMQRMAPPLLVGDESTWFPLGPPAEASCICKGVYIPNRPIQPVSLNFYQSVITNDWQKSNTRMIN